MKIDKLFLAILGLIVVAVFLYFFARKTESESKGSNQKTDETITNSQQIDDDCDGDKWEIVPTSLEIIPGEEGKKYVYTDLSFYNGSENWGKIQLSSKDISLSTEDGFEYKPIRDVLEEREGITTTFSTSDLKPVPPKFFISPNASSLLFQIAETQHQYLLTMKNISIDCFSSDAIVNEVNIDLNNQVRTISNRERIDELPDFIGGGFEVPELGTFTFSGIEYDEDKISVNFTFHNASLEYEKIGFLYNDFYDEFGYAHPSIPIGFDAGPGQSNVLVLEIKNDLPVGIHAMNFYLSVVSVEGEDLSIFDLLKYPRAPLDNILFKINIDPPFPTSTIISGDFPIVTAMRDINCREGPGLEYSIIGFLRRNQTSEAVGQDTLNEWWNIRLPDNPNQICWVQAEFINVEGTPILTPTLALLFQSTKPSDWMQGKIAYIVEHGKGNNVKTELKMIDFSDNEEPVLITQQQGRISAPDWSPDGNQVSFYLNYEGKFLNVVDAKPQSTPKNLGACSWNSWSPDGSQIACRYEKIGNTFIKIIETITGEIVELMEIGEMRTLDWSPVLEEFVISVGKGYNTQIWRISKDGISSIPLTESDCPSFDPNYSPDGEWIVFRSNCDTAWSEIWIMNRDGKHKRRITTTKGWSDSPDWSPDGNYLAFVSSQAGSAGSTLGELFIISLIDEKLIKLTSTNGRVANWGVSWGK